jgi:hypothetical protein
MTDLAASNVTVTEYQGLNNLVPNSNARFNIVDIAFGNAALTYPSGGVPMPATDKFGMFEQIDMLLIQQPAGDLLDYRYDRTNHKIRIIDISAGAELTASSSAPAACTLRAMAVGS